MAIGQYDSSLVNSFERHGEDWVRSRFLTGEWGPPDSTAHSQAKEWLAIKEAARRDAKDEETLSIARVALRNSKWANIIAITAMVLSVIMAIIQMVKLG